MSYSYPEDNEHLFAVIFAVAGTDKDQFIPVVWNNVAHTFAALKNNGFADDNIYILFNDGSPDGIGTHFPKLDLNNDEEHDILENVVCNKGNLEDIFDNLKEVMDDDDLLFMYSYTHGYKIDQFNNKTKLGLWNDEIYDSELASMVEKVDCSELIYINEACHGGGIVDDFAGIHQTVVTPVEWGKSILNPGDEVEELGYTPYSYAIITALRGEHPKSNTEPWFFEYSLGNHPTLNEYEIFDHLDGDFNPDM